MRLANLAETFGCRPSDYFEGDLRPYDRFCIDEAALVALSIEKKKIYEEQRNKNTAESPQEGKAEIGTKPAGLSDFLALEEEAKAARAELQKRIILQK